MARAVPDDHRQPVGDLGVRVDVTVIPGPRGPTLRERIAPVRNRWVVGCLAAAAVLAGALGALVALTGSAGAPQRLPTTVLPNTVLYPTYLRDTGPVAPSPAPYSPAAAHPLRCLRLLIALHDPSLRDGAFIRNLPCGRPHGPYTLISVPAPGPSETHR